MQECRTPAKVNLCLNVVGKEGSYHLLDGVYACISLYDTVTLTKNGLNVCRIFYTDGRRYENDVAYNASEFLRAFYHTEGFDVTISKNIPEKMGLGGSSADAAGVVRAFEKEFFCTVDRELLMKMGSDVPFQVSGGCARVRGRGERIEKLSLPPLHICLLLPAEGISTAECFHLFDTVGGERADVESCIESLQNKKQPIFQNSLFRGACLLNDKVTEGVSVLKNAGFACGMTGSGSALFGAEYDEKIFREKLKKVKADDFTVLTAVTEE